MSKDKERSLESFLDGLRKKDILAMFNAWYRKNHAENPEGFPLDLYTGEWLDTLGGYLYDLDESDLQE